MESSEVLDAVTPKKMRERTAAQGPCCELTVTWLAVLTCLVGKQRAAEALEGMALDEDSMEAKSKNGIHDEMVNISLVH